MDTDLGFQRYFALLTVRSGDVREVTHHEVDEGREEDHVEPPEVCIRQEATEQRHHSGNACPVVDILGGRLYVLVHLRGQVRYEIRCYPEVAQPLTEFNRCTMFLTPYLINEELIKRIQS